MSPLAELDETTGKTSRVAVFHAAGQKLSLDQISLPRLADGESLVRVECCTVCGSDLHTITGKRAEKTPTILGHEICGRIAAVSFHSMHDIDGVPLSVGDRVTWSVSVSCGNCDRCRGGLPQKCRTLAKFGHEATDGRWPLSGGLAEFILLPVGTQVIRLPVDLPANVVCPANCATATVAAACRMAGPLAGKRVLIFGAGMLGLTAAAMARSQSASHIVICDRDKERLVWAEQFGAHASLVWNDSHADLRQELRDSSGDQGFDVILELSGSPDAIELGCSVCDIGAKVILVGTVMKSRPVQLDPEMLVRRWISIHGVHNYTPDDLRTAVRFLTENHNRYPLHELVARTFSLNEINDAIDYAIQHRPIRIAIVP
jgi:putative phosphonate catabolism associated alcohol dehydrogenase